MACLGGPDLGPGPLNVLITRTMPEVCEGDPVAAIGQVLRVGDSEIGLAAARTWRAERAGLVARESLARLRMARGPAGSLADLLPEILHGPRASAHPLLDAARPVLLALREWARGGAFPDVSPVIGLGPGLTPAGDDALAGAMIAARQCGAPDLADSLAEAVLPIARTATGKISHAHLAAAADGEGAAAMHEALAALAADAPLEQALARLSAIGHSSGWDGLAGAAAVLAGLADRVRG